MVRENEVWGEKMKIMGQGMGQVCQLLNSSYYAYDGPVWPEMGISVNRKPMQEFCFCPVLHLCSTKSLTIWFIDDSYVLNSFPRLYGPYFAHA
ncbi:hypothetical protein HAX54_000228 [Datura stramonium]|uniref:Uncharacterized protein n=1 Tax=Datura stramonium TaxID=4076 RepID=A0ABS8T2Z5_DATST|nr:hypothetical protein [Datura stramonium]